MSGLDQIQVTYVPGEDRLLLRVSTSSNEEFRFWLTRRYVRLVRPHLEQQLVSQPRISTQANPVAQRELYAFERQQAVQSADFQTPYKQEEKALPLGAEPLLLTRFAMRPTDAGGVSVTLAPEQGQGIDLALTPQLVHSIMALLDNALKTADWALAPASPPAAEPPSQPSTIN